MRDTDRLFKSFLPGRVAGARYLPRKEQIYRLDEGKLTIGSSVPYADDTAEERPVFPKDMDLWIAQSLEVAIKEVITKIEE